MALTHSHARLLMEVQSILTRDAGYAEGQVLCNYTFADYSGATPKVRQVDLAAFARGVPSYRSACVAVKIVAPGEEAVEAVQLAALGASKALIISAGEASIWMLGSKRGAERKATHAVADLPHLLRTTAADWSPANTSRANRSIAPGAYQIDLIDLGFIEALEAEINTKLHRLLNEVFRTAEQRLPKLRTSKLRFPGFVRSVFCMLTAKVLADRAHPIASGGLTTAAEAIRVAQAHLGKEFVPKSLGPALLDEAWRTIRSQFHFQNVSTDNLAFIYERALVDDVSRKTLGIHATPRWVAEQVLDLLPLDELPSDRQRVLELCSGYGPFLLAALERLKPLAPADPAARHAWLVDRLHGVELEPFALEVSRLCLTLADYPSPDGWRLEQGDIFSGLTLKKAIRGAGVVLSNPPFEDFSVGQHANYNAQLWRKPAELIRRILELEPPFMLGFVLPRSLIESRQLPNQEWHSRLRKSYRELDTIVLPDKVFSHADETVLLVARNPNGANRFTLRTAWFDDEALPTANAWRPQWLTEERQEADSRPLLLDPLSAVWQRLDGCDSLGQHAEVHRGIQYNATKSATLVRLSDPGTSHAPGVTKAQQITVYRAPQSQPMVTESDAIAVGGNFAWTKPKLVASSARRSRKAWCITAGIDEIGLWCYQSAYGIWPRARSGFELEVLAAILNGPLANAWVHGRSGKRHIQGQVYKSIPLPRLNRLDTVRIKSLVRLAIDNPTLEVVLQIDAEVLRGYGLPARLEAQLLRSLEGMTRPGLPEFERYYPEGFESHLTLREALRLLTPANRGAALSKRLPRFDSPAVSALFDFIEEST